MNRSNHDPSLSAVWLLRVVRRVFPGREITDVVGAALADFHGELREAGQHRLGRLLVRCRWYLALVVLVAIAPLRVPISPVTGASVRAHSRSGGLLVVILTVGLSAGMWNLWGGFVLWAATAGVALAWAMRSWHDRHPSTLVTPQRSDTTALPEINLSSIPVAGDAAGLLFAAGSVVLVVLGLPGLAWLFVAIAVASVLVAGGLFLWRRSAAHGAAGYSIR